MKTNTIVIIIVVIVILGLLFINSQIKANERQQEQEGQGKAGPCGPKPWFRRGGTLKCINGKWVSYSCGPRPGSVGNWRCAGNTAWVNIDSRDSMSYFLVEYAGLSGAVDRMTDDQLRRAIINF